MNRALLTDDEIHDAALWRLAGWSQEEIAAGSARIARLRERDIPLTSDQAEVAQALAAFTRRSDRREPWSALMALAVLHADAHGDRELFLRAGFAVVGAWRNACIRRHGGAPRNALTEQMREFQTQQPDAAADDCFDFWTRMAGLHHPLFVDYDSEQDKLTWDDRGRLRDMSRASFARQFRRVRASVGRTQRVDVRAAA